MFSQFLSQYRLARSTSSWVTPFSPTDLDGLERASSGHRWVHFRRQPQRLTLKIPGS